ncbi:MerR family transcriptional regulator [Bacillus sp. JCM 19034]|uniref:MerR family transcriptional regulator n=1 Tax=Bacillus sp. JCM 19034 TaxID=1481928 RepID=UPI0007835DE8|nr:MerR family transcriptional regulator [Bacillus sp. JCM 19034]
MKISELSKKTGVSIRSIRHYEKKNLITSTRLDNGYREFEESSIERIKTIQLYLGLGLTTDQIEEFLSCIDSYPQYEMEELCDEVFDVYEDKLAEINKKIYALSIVKQRLEEQIKKKEDRVLTRSNHCVAIKSN